MSEFSADFIFKNFLKISTAICIVIAFMFILSPFLIPLLLGGVLAMAFSPFIAYFLKKGWSRKISVAVVSLGLFMLGLVPVTIIFVKGSKLITPLLSEQLLIQTKHKIEDKIYAVLDNFSDLYGINPVEAHERFNHFVSTVGNWVLRLISQLLSEIPDAVMLSFITVLSFYFFLVDEIRIRKWFDRFFNFSNNNGDRFIALIKSSCNEVFFSNVLTGFIQASIISIGAFFASAGDLFIIFFFAFFLSFIPVIGAAPVAFLTAALCFLDGHVGAGITMAIFGVVAGISDNLIRPYLTSRGEVKVPIFASFLSIIGGVVVLGLPGLFLGPLLASLTYGALPIIFDEYFNNKKSNVSDDQLELL